MGVDMTKVRQKAEEEAQKAQQRSAGGFKYWKAKNGKNRVRFMPPWSEDPNNPNANQFWREIYMHFGVGDGGDDEENGMAFPCPVKTPHSPAGATCPICSYVAELRATKDPMDLEQANRIRAKQRFYSNIVDLDDPTFTQQDVDEWKSRQEDKTRECGFKVGETKVQVFSYGPMIYKELLDVFCDQQIDITDLNTGHDVTIHRETPDPKKPRETKYRTRPDFDEKPFAVKGRPLAEALVDLDKINPFASAADMEAALNGNAPPPKLGGQQPANGGAPSLPRGGSAPAPAANRALPPAQKPQQQQVQRLPQPAQQQQEEEAASQEDAPPCFKDLKTCNDKDPECVGGQKPDGQGGMDQYDPCPFFAPCNEAKLAVLKPPTPRGRRAARGASTDTSTPDAVKQLEDEMRNAVKQ